MFQRSVKIQKKLLADQLIEIISWLAIIYLQIPAIEI